MKQSVNLRSWETSTITLAFKLRLRSDFRLGLIIDNSLFQIDYNELGKQLSGNASQIRDIIADLKTAALASIDLTVFNAIVI